MSDRIITNHERDLLGTLRISDAPTMMFAVGIIDRLNARLAAAERALAASVKLREYAVADDPPYEDHAIPEEHWSDALKSAVDEYDAAVAEWESAKGTP